MAEAPRFGAEPGRAGAAGGGVLPADAPVCVRDNGRGGGDGRAGADPPAAAVPAGPLAGAVGGSGGWWRLQPGRDTGGDGGGRRPSPLGRVVPRVRGGGRAGDPRDGGVPDGLPPTPGRRGGGPGRAAGPATS